MKKKKIVLGVCGSVAAIESPKIARELVRRGYEVECVMTKAAKKIIHPYVMEWATQRKPITKITGAVEHVRLCGVGGEASLLLICPATANTMSKIACGIDDTTVTTFASTALGAGIPIAIVPAMHSSMYKNPFLSANIKRLEANGIKVVEPRIAEDKAKLADAEKIIKEVEKCI